MTKQKRTVQKFLVLVAIASLVLTGLGATPAFSAWPLTSSNVSANSSRSVNSSVAVDKSGTVHVVWEEADTEIYYSKSTDGGATWSAAANVSRSPGLGTPSRSPKIAIAPDGSVHVAWVEYTTNWEIYYSQFRNNQWSIPVNISRTSSFSDSPQIAIDSTGKIHVVWQDNHEVAYSSSTDGQTWPTRTILSDGSGGSYDGEPPSLSTAGSNLHLAWQHQSFLGEPPTRYYDIHYRMYNGTSGIWEAPAIIYGPSTTYRGTPVIAADTYGKPHVIWVNEATAGAATEIFYSRLEGTGWIPPLNISNTGTPSGRPVIAADGAGHLHAAWDEMISSTDYDIYYSRFNGGSWSYRENVLNNTSQSEAPAIAADGTANPNIVWQDSGSGNSDILFARATGPVTIFSTGFENAPRMTNTASGWDVGDDDTRGTQAYWAEKLETTSWDTAHSGSWGAWCAGFGGDTTNHLYRSYMNAYARTTFDLTYFRDATLTFWYRFNAPNDTTDLDLGVLNIILNGNSAHPIQKFYQDTAPQPWTLETIDLTPYMGNKVTLEWRWVSDENSTVGEGMYLDDIAVTGNSQDQVAPAAVSNLAAGSPNLTSLNLTWTAPGDDGTSGTATTYDVRYSTSPIDDSNWASAMQASGEAAPKLAGSSETFTVTGLNSGTTYYFAIKTADERGNWSYLSNVPSAQTASTATIPLGVGWNLVSLPHSPVTAQKAQDVLNNINTNAGATIATQISRWNNAKGTWETRINGQPINNFDVVLGEGYFIKVTAPGNWTVVGTQLTAPVTLNLGTGWNLSAVPYSATAYKAQDLINAIKLQGGSASQVSRWNNAKGTWETRIDGQPINNFNIVPGEGYFIKAASSSVFTP